MASQCADKVGKPCLKLRFCDDIKRKCRKSNIDLNKSFVRKEIAQEKMHGNIYSIAMINLSCISLINNLSLF